MIRQELEAADAAIVIWTPQSINSTYVKMEAGAAYAWEKLITVRTPDLPINALPDPFRGLHTVLVTDVDQIMIALDELGVRPKAAGKAKKLTKDEILAALGKVDPALPPAVEAFLRECQRDGFRIVTNKSIMIKSAIPNFGEVNFGTLFPEGKLQTNYISDLSERIGDQTIAADYLNGLARLINGASVRRDGKPWTWRVEVFGELPEIAGLLERSEDWLALMKEARTRFAAAARRR